VLAYGTRQGVISNGNQQENDLSTTYSSGATYLSTCVIKTNQVANVAAANADAFDKVIKDAIAGSGSAQHINLGTPGGQSSFLPILVQAYPQLQGQTDLYKKVVDTIVGCQDDFRGQQSVVLDKVRTFNNWRTGSWKVRTFGGSFPNNNLSVTIPGITPLHGQSALDKISQPIVDSVTAATYNSGQQSTSGPFASPSPSHS
jgi:hypothetical protein